MPRHSAASMPHLIILWSGTGLETCQSRQNPVRAKTISSSNFKAILAVQSRTKKFFASCSGQITGYFDASRLDKRGVRVVTDVGRGMRWTRHVGGRTAMSADGEVVWFWRPDAGVKLATVLSHRADDGGKKARSPGRARRKPLTPSRRECR
jgi:hypothetical protein